MWSICGLNLVHFVWYAKQIIMALTVCCSDILFDPWLDRFVGSGVTAVNLLSLTRGILCFPQTIPWGVNYAVDGPFC